MTERFNVIGCQISKVTKRGAIDKVLEGVRSGRGGYVCFTNVHTSVTAHGNPKFLTVLNESFLTFPDGKPLYWVGKLKGIGDVEQVPGPEFLPELLETDATPPLRHYFYGGRPEVLEILIANLKAGYPHADIVGWESPPFRELTEEEDEQVVARIRDSGTHIVWVGLGAPKQEYWMQAHAERLKPALLMGVGAAFDFHAGSVKRAPGWMRFMGLEWLHRLIQEPRRLWKRYLVTNTLFIFYVLKGLFIR